MPLKLAILDRYLNGDEAMVAAGVWLCAFDFRLLADRLPLGLAHATPTNGVYNNYSAVQPLNNGATGASPTPIYLPRWMTTTFDADKAGPK